VPLPPLRIVSLAPGATAMLFEAGAGAQVLATSAYSLEPPAARRLPRIGDAYSVDLERLVSLHPDVVVVWDGGNNPAQIERIARLGIPLYRERVQRLADMPASLRRLGRLAGTGAAADAAAQRFAVRLAALRERYRGAAPITVLLEVLRHPLYTLGPREAVSDALGICGAQNIFEDLGPLASAVSTEAVIARDPQVIIALASRAEGAAWLADWRRFPQLNAVRDGNLLDFDDLRLTRLGPAMLDATEELCALIDRARARARDRRGRPALSP